MTILPPRVAPKSRRRKCAEFVAAAMICCVVGIYMCCDFLFRCGAIDPKSGVLREVGAASVGIGFHGLSTNSCFSAGEWREIGITNGALVMTVRTPKKPSPSSNAWIQVFICNTSTGRIRCVLGNDMQNIRIGRNSVLGQTALYVQAGKAHPLGWFRFDPPDYALRRGDFDENPYGGYSIGPMDCAFHQYGLGEALAMRRKGDYEISVAWDSWPRSFLDRPTDPPNFHLSITGILYQIAEE